ncbi:uncharacterized protein LOC132648290 [Meriones unguiculatus]|uniref:uncharacterized protein LOC132648290 n=1 Tax=Meriones unguiculatus TaxID=10047 RepID=UPI00293F6D80|nr:uncharacterized protein LOC132648290 [Meriones unguiculatus]
MKQKLHPQAPRCPQSRAHFRPQSGNRNSLLALPAGPQLPAPGLVQPGRPGFSVQLWLSWTRSVLDTKLASNLQRSTCLCLPSVGIKGLLTTPQRGRPPWLSRGHDPLQKACPPELLMRTLGPALWPRADGRAERASSPGGGLRPAERKAGSREWRPQRRSWSRPCGGLPSCRRPGVGRRERLGSRFSAAAGAAASQPGEVSPDPTGQCSAPVSSCLGSDDLALLWSSPATRVSLLALASLSLSSPHPPSAGDTLLVWGSQL